MDAERLTHKQRLKEFSSEELHETMKASSAALEVYHLCQKISTFNRKMIRGAKAPLNKRFNQQLPGPKTFESCM
eukprot:scaffold312_cov409-Pavlova_lutheri.AAC.4